MIFCCPSAMWHDDDPKPATVPKLRANSKHWDGKIRKLPLFSYRIRFFVWSEICWNPFTWFYLLQEQPPYLWPGLQNLPIAAKDWLTVERRVSISRRSNGWLETALLRPLIFTELTVKAGTYVTLKPSHQRNLDATAKENQPYTIQPHVWRVGTVNAWIKDPRVFYTKKTPPKLKKSRLSSDKHLFWVRGRYFDLYGVHVHFVSKFAKYVFSFPVPVFQHVTVKEGGDQRIDCGADQVIHIRSAKYTGKDCFYNVHVPVEGLCGRKHTCDLNPTLYNQSTLFTYDNYYGTKCPGNDNVLDVDYFCQPGKNLFESLKTVFFLQKIQVQVPVIIA